jgi:hypothetical protein
MAVGKDFGGNAISFSTFKMGKTYTDLKECVYYEVIAASSTERRKRRNRRKLRRRRRH